MFTSAFWPRSIKFWSRLLIPFLTCLFSSKAQRRMRSREDPERCRNEAGVGLMTVYSSQKMRIWACKIIRKQGCQRAQRALALGSLAIVAFAQTSAEFLSEFFAGISKYVTGRRSVTLQKNPEEVMNFAKSGRKH